MEDETLPVEAAIIGSMILDPTCIEEVKSYVHVGMFVYPRHRTLFQTVTDLHDEGEVDLILLRAELIKFNRLEEVGGMDYLCEMLEALPSAANAIYYCRRLVEHYGCRNMADHASEVSRIVADPNLSQEEKVYSIEQDFRTKIQQAISRQATDTDTVVNNVRQIIEHTIDGRRAAIRMPWHVLTEASKAILSGTITILCGSAGASKSFMLLEAMAFWRSLGVDCCVYELEENVEYHIMRAIAQQSCNSQITDPDWIKEHPIESRAVLQEHLSLIRDMAKVIMACDTSLPTLGQLADWVEGQARGGKRIIGIDPVTIAVHTQRDIWNEDRAFLERLKHTAVTYQCSIILVTHPTKLNIGPSLDSLAGGAAFGRFSQSAIWLENHSRRTGKVLTSCGTDDGVEYNRTLHILKARNGRGQGLRIACDFMPDSLTIHEVGIIKGD